MGVLSKVRKRTARRTLMRPPLRSMWPSNRNAKRKQEPRNRSEKSERKSRAHGHHEARIERARQAMRHGRAIAQRRRMGGLARHKRKSEQNGKACRNCP